MTDIVPPSYNASQLKATKSEKLRCGVGYKPADQEKPAVSKKLVETAATYGELHKYCADQYGDAFVAYVSAPGMVIKAERNMQGAYQYEIGSRAICCKELPEGMNRVTFFNNARIANAEAATLHVAEARELEQRLLRLTDSFSLCTKGAGCYELTNIGATTLSNSFRMLESIVLNHIAHINRCLMKDVYDPLSNCMNLTQLKAYLNQNKTVIDQLFDIIETILLKIEKDDAISKMLGLKADAKPAKPATLRALNLVFDGVKSLAAFTLKHKWSLLIGAVFLVSGTAIIGPSLKPVADAFSGRGLNAGAAKAFSELSTIMCRFVSKPMVFSLVVSSIIYYIVNTKAFTAILSATLSSAAFTAKFAAYAATLGAASIPISGFTKYLEENGITWEALVKGFFQNKASTLVIYAIPQMIMSWLGFIVQGLISTWCIVSDTAMSVQQLASTAVDYGTFGLQWFTNKVLGTAAPEALAPGIVANITGSTIDKIAQLADAVNNNSVAIAEAAKKVFALAGVTELVQQSAPIFEPFIQTFFGEKSAELGEVSRLRNGSSELQDYVVNETEITKQASDSFMKEFLGQSSPLSKYDQGRLSNNAVVKSQLVLLKALSTNITPHRFMIAVESGKRGTSNARAADISVSQDTLTLNVLPDSLKDLKNIPAIQEQVKKAEESKIETKKTLQKASAELAAAADQANTEEEKKIYDDEITHLINLSESLNTPIPAPRIIPTLLNPKVIKIEAQQIVIERPQMLTLDAKEKPMAKEALVKKPVSSFTPPQQEREETKKDAGKAIALVALSEPDLKAVQKDIGATALILDETKTQVKAIIDEKTGEISQVDGPLATPQGPMLLPIVAASKTFLESIQSGVALKKTSAAELEKSLEKARQRPLAKGDATKFDVSNVLLNAFNKKFRSVNSTAKEDEGAFE